MDGLEGRAGVEFWFRMGDSVGMRAELLMTAGMPGLDVQP